MPGKSSPAVLLYSDLNIFVIYKNQLFIVRVNERMKYSRYGNEIFIRVIVRVYDRSLCLNFIFKKVSGISFSESFKVRCFKATIHANSN